MHEFGKVTWSCVGVTLSLRGSHAKIFWEGEKAARRWQLTLARCPSIGSRRYSHDRLEIPDEVSLVAVPQIQSQL